LAEFAWDRGVEEEPEGRNNVRNDAKREQHAAPLADRRWTRAWVPGSHAASGVRDAEVFSEQAGGAEGRIQGSGPGTENPSAFMAASMQGVIQQLREQEKELDACIVSRENARNRRSG